MYYVRSVLEIVHFMNWSSDVQGQHIRPATSREYVPVSPCQRYVIVLLIDCYVCMSYYVSKSIFHPWIVYIRKNKHRHATYFGSILVF